MKKSLLSKFAVLAIAVLFSLTACEKEQKNEQVALGKATIKGKVQVNLNANDDAPTFTWDKVPAGTKLYAKISSKDLILVPSTSGAATYSDIYYETTVDASGEYTFTIDANKKNVPVTITSDDFRADFTAFGGTKETGKIFTLTALITETVVQDAVKFRDITFVAKP